MTASTHKDADRKLSSDTTSNDLKKPNSNTATTIDINPGSVEVHLKLKVCRCSSENASDASGVIENGDIPTSLTMQLNHKTLSSENTNEIVNENNRLSGLDNNNYRKDKNNSISSDNLYINGMENNTNFSSSSDTSKTNNNNVVVENDDVLILKICDLENIIREHKCKSKKSPSVIASPVKLIACKAQKCQMDNKRGSIVATVSNSSTTAAAITTTSGKKATKSVGTQHFNSHHLASNSIVKSKKSTQNNEIIIVSDQFKAQALKNQNVVVDSKRKILKLMKSQRMNSRSLEDLRQNSDLQTTNGIDTFIGVPPRNTHHSPSRPSFTNASPRNIVGGDTLKAISKSVDNVSITSDGGVFDNFGSVELVFISDEFLNKANNHNIIIVEENQSANKSMTKTASQTGPSSAAVKMASKPKKAITVSASIDSSSTGAATLASSGSQKKKIISISDDFRRNSVKNKVVVLSEPRKRLKDMKLKRNSSQESSVDDVGNKITSHAFHSYDEEQEDLESKELQQTHL